MQVHLPDFHLEPFLTLDWPSNSQVFSSSTSIETAVWGKYGVEESPLRFPQRSQVWHDVKHLLIADTLCRPSSADAAIMCWHPTLSPAGIWLVVYRLFDSTDVPVIPDQYLGGCLKCLSSERGDVIVHSSGDFMSCIDVKMVSELSMLY